MTKKEDAFMAYKRIYGTLECYMRDAGDDTIGSLIKDDETLRQYIEAPVPEGYALVPIEPTTTIVNKLCKLNRNEGWFYIYKSIVEAGRVK